MATRSNDELLDLLLLGLVWVQGDSDPVGWTGNGVFHTLRLARVLDRAQYGQLVNGDEALRSFLVPQTQLLPLQPNARTHNIGIPRMRRACGSTEKLLVAAVHTGMFFGDMLFTPRGYKLAASAKGRERAAQAAPKYADVVTRESFRAQWDLHARQVRAMHAERRQGRD